MVISVQRYNLLSLLHDMCAHKNLATYTPAAGEVSRAELADLEIGTQEQWAAAACVFNDGRARQTRSTSPTRQGEFLAGKANDQAGCLVVRSGRGAEI